MTFNLYISNLIKQKANIYRTKIKDILLLKFQKSEPFNDFTEGDETYDVNEIRMKLGDPDFIKKQKLKKYNHYKVRLKIVLL